MEKKSLVFSSGILKIAHLENFLWDCQIIRRRMWKKTLHAEQVIGWGHRPSTKKARHFAQKYQIPFIALEDGFLRSVGLGVEGYSPLSIVYDDIGIYYDTTVPSRLEKLILSVNLTNESHQQVSDAITKIKEYQLSKYNHAPDFELKHLSDKPIVLVIDQTFGDMAVKFGQANEWHFNQMLETAIKENPQADIWVKTHPDVISGKKKGYLTCLPQYAHQVKILSEDISPLSLLQYVDKVYCVTSHMGFEALLIGKKVITFGIPWYAGWGITDDRHESIVMLQQQNRRSAKTFNELFFAAYFSYSRYINPNNGQIGSIFDVIEYLNRVKQWNNRLRGQLYCVGMSLWKQAVIKPFFNLPSCKVHFIRSHNVLSKKNLNLDARLLVWGNGKTEQIRFAQQNQLPILRMEDGFIRSVGLGSNLVAPISLVIDDMGIYFNSQMPSRLEKILQEQVFSKEDITIAQMLRHYLVDNKIGKYNVGDIGFQLTKSSLKTILVPGQVEDDASIKTGSPYIRTNLDLLKRVRELNPEAYILYKPHPDVVSGNRKGNVAFEEVKKFADDIIETANILDCIIQVDEVHTMTSLAGFEALLRGKIVHCYGLPFYSGWGLTNDHFSLSDKNRRKRKLSLDELVSGVLVYYPLYINPKTNQLIDAKQAINSLMLKREELSSNGIRRNWVAKQSEKLKHLFYSILKSK